MFDKDFRQKYNKEFRRVQRRAWIAWAIWTAVSFGLLCLWVAIKLWLELL